MGILDKGRRYKFRLYYNRTATDDRVWTVVYKNQYLHAANVHIEVSVLTKTRTTRSPKGWLEGYAYISRLPSFIRLN
jgi:hypothetical protein